MFSFQVFFFFIKLCIKMILNYVRYDPIYHFSFCKMCVKWVLIIHNVSSTPIQNAESLTIFKWHLKTNPFRLSLIINKNKHLCSLSLTSPCLTSFSSEQCLKFCITSTSCDCLPLYNVSLIVFLNCKSLKASAKLLNVMYLQVHLNKLECHGKMYLFQ